MKSIHVVAAIIFSPQRDRVLISRRHEHLHQGGKWEFPGGKIEPGEAAGAALARELHEELGIDINIDTSELLTEVSHDYPEKSVNIQFWQVVEFTGEALGREQQEVRWVSVSQLDTLSFPPANRAVLALLHRETP